MNVGYISLHRKIQDCFLWYSDEPFDRRSAWIDLLLLVNHEAKEIIFAGNKVEILTGQKITSIRSLAERWHWSTTKVRKFLEMLESENMIKIESDNKKTLITVVNYEFYQNAKHTENTQKTHGNNTEITQEIHENDTEITQKNLNNNDNNENNENNDNKKDIPPKSPKAKKTKEPPLTKEQMQSMVDESDLNDRIKEELNIFVQYKIQRGDEYTSIGFSRLINQVKKYCLSHGTNNVIDCMELSMSNNWQGIIWEKIKQPSGAEKFPHDENINKYEQSQEESTEDDDEEWSDERWEEEFRKRGL